MKRLILILLFLLTLRLDGFSQTATSLNEGSTLISLGSNSYRFTWWARAGVFYLVDMSTDLIHWNYTNDLYLGINGGGVSQPVSFNNVTGDRLFVRLQRDPFNIDSDGDGIPDGWEVFYRFNARYSGDATGNPDGDAYNNREEYVLGLNPLFNEYGNGVRTQIYTYDDANRLTNSASNLTEGFSYDNEGNLTNSQ